MNNFFKCNNLMFLFILLSFVGCTNNDKITISKIVDNSLSQKKPVLLYLYKGNTLQYKKFQAIFMNDKIQSYIKNSFLYYEIDETKNSYFQELMYSCQNNLFLILHGDSISSIFSSVAIPALFLDKLSNHSKYSFPSQIKKYTLLMYDEQLIDQTINKIFRLQYFKEKKRISLDKFYAEIRKTIDEMPYFYNNYLLADLALDINQNFEGSYFKQMTKMENKVYESLLQDYLLRVNNIPLNGLAKVHYECLKHDFGVFRANDTVCYYFKYKSIGKVPYIIYNVESSCHCTVSKWSRKPIPPNGQDSINVSFTRLSIGKFRKFVNVKSNAGKDVLLEVIGEIVP